MHVSLAGAPSVLLQERYGVPQLAKAFVKYPAVALHSLLQSWTEYKQSTEYLSQKQRSGHTSSPEYRQDEERWTKTATVHRLRHSRRQAMRHEDKLLQGEATTTEIEYHMRLLEYYRSGELDTDLREATVAHGFGYLSLIDGEVLNLTAPSFEGFLMPSGCRGCSPGLPLTYYTPNKSCLTAPSPVFSS